MRVRTLHLRNFRRHADTRVELPDGVTALLGANGAGKSSLLEGIAFALFGTDGLRTGKSLARMEGSPPGDAVEATLEVELAGQALTIRRELRGKALTPSASLVVDGALVVPPGAGSSDAVTQHVVRRLGMGPDAFFTTIVARQGELARLANESPAERKRMVLRMLGVDRIDAAIDQARERRRDAQASVDALRRLARDPAQAAAAHAQAGARLAAAQAASAQAQAAWTAAQQAVAQARSALQAAQAQAEARRTLAAEAEALRRELVVREAAVQQAASLLAQAQAAERECARLAPVAAALPGLEAEWAEAQRALAVARQRALQEQVVARLETERDAAAAQRAALPAPPLEDGLTVAESELGSAQAQVDQARQRLAAATALLQQAKVRRQRVAALGAEAPCPTCERPLGGHLQTLVHLGHDAEAHADQEVAAARVAEGQAAALLAAARERRDRAAENQRRRERHAAEARALDTRVADLAARLAEAQAHLPPAAPPPAGVEALRLRLAEAQRARDAANRLAAVAESVPALVQRHAEAAATRELAAQAASAAEARLATVADPAPALVRATAALADAQARERGAERDVHDAGRVEAAAAEAARHAQAALEEALRVQAELASLGVEAQEWTALADNGKGLLERFRDHVVDRIGPAIQAEASRMLARFTGGRYTELLLDSAYNVYVTDGGVPYTVDRFSGGEQDLAHLALRLAVSRLLAERGGGGELRFLALDEVFGSLDAQRRELVVGALGGLSGLYSQVLVVSHQEALQESLDQALLVSCDGGQARVHIQNG